MVQRYDIEAVVANSRAQLATMAANAKSPRAKAAYRANEAYIDFIRWAAGELNQINPGDDASGTLRAAAMVIAQQMLGVAHLVTSADHADIAIAIMMDDIGQYLVAALGGDVKFYSVDTPIVNVGDA